jgi:hypothetical protein
MIKKNFGTKEELCGFPLLRINVTRNNNNNNNNSFEFLILNEKPSNPILIKRQISIKGMIIFDRNRGGSSLSLVFQQIAEKSKKARKLSKILLRSLNIPIVDGKTKNQ